MNYKNKKLKSLQNKHLHEFHFLFTRGILISFNLHIDLSVEASTKK